MALQISLTLGALFFLTSAASAASPGTVYLVLGSDTAVWNAPGGLDVGKYREHFDSALYTQPQANAYQAIAPTFRQQYVDSFGQPLKLTWWMLVGSAYGQADNTDVPIPNLMPLYLMQHYHGEALHQLGDEVSLHYHTFLWSDYDGDGVYYWNEARQFHDCRADFDLALAQSLLEENVFPVSFRSGWHYMDNEWQAYLNQLLLYSMDDDYPNVRAWYTNEPIFNVLDWSQAPGDFVPWNPSSTNYQAAGDGPGWNVRSVKFQNVSQELMDQMFAAAAGGTDQVASLWGHLPESDFLDNLARMDAMAHAAVATHPGVLFRYCTAVEAMQRWRGLTDQTPPQLDLTEDPQADSVRLRLHTSEAIFQPQPFVAVKDIFAQYQIVPCQAAGINAWTATLPWPQDQIAKYGIAVTDPAGNLTTRIVRYLPDDLFLDNLDAAYQEVAGSWIATNNAAWGVDARLALLASNETAEVRWGLPITSAGPYHAFVQVPAVSHPAGHLQFTFYAGDSNLLSIAFTNPLPARQWVYLGTPSLDPAVTNFLEMRVSAEGRTNTCAVADVLKLSPLTLPLPGFIIDMQVDPADTTANLIWTTPSPATAFVEYGRDTTYGSFSQTNSAPTRTHVVTLTGLRPGSSYAFRLDSMAGELRYTWSGNFTTANPDTHTAWLFGVTDLWRYTTNNLDGANWQAQAYDDSTWPSGLGLLWVDTRAGGPDPAVKSKNTEMPANPATGDPFVTYYFRRHFSFTNDPSVTSITFSNYIDDGAVFYLNGAEIHRNNLPPPPVTITNTTLATGYNCGGDATCPVVFTLPVAALTNLVAGDNLLAVEVHNYALASPDITFGSALGCIRITTPPPTLRFALEGGRLTLFWNGNDYTLQQASSLATGTPNWTDVPGPITHSPYVLPASSTTFYRLKK